MTMKKDRTHSSSGSRDDKHSYYYVQGQKVNVSKRDDLVAVRFHSRAPGDSIRAFATARGSELKPSEEFKEMQAGSLRFFHVSTPQENGTRGLARELRSQDNVEKVGDVYVNDNGGALVLTDELVVKFKPDITSDQVDALKTTYGLETEETLGFSENAFVLKVKPESDKTSLEVANDLVEKGEAVYANPSWIEYIPHRVLAEPELREEVRHLINDPLFANQWHLENTGQGGGTVDADVDAHSAWHITQGNPDVRVAIIDGGIDISHEDLNTPGKIVDPLDLDVTPPDNNPAGGAHGTSCAGVAVAAQNNGRGGSGIAPRCRLIPIKAASDATGTQVRIATAFQYAADHHADVISCSLGPDGVPWLLSDVLREAFDYATTYGRNGRGCVIFWAGGNGNESISTDQIVSYERTIAVGASNNFDRRSWYSDYGPELDIVAPSNDRPPQGTGTREITTTTNTGAGSATVHPSKNYTDTFGGTSSASPLAAGIGALALSVNAKLSWEEVRQVLLDSAEKIDAAANPYTPAPVGRPPGIRNNRYGYGRVNAIGAVLSAQALSTRDLYIRDTVNDTGTVPQPAWGFWDSPDIWVRNLDDGGTAHQATVRGQDNVLHACVRNRGSRASLPCWVRFYITSYAGTEFRYPYDFKPDTTAGVAGGTPGNLRPRHQFPAIGTYLIGEKRLESVPAGGNVIAKVIWEKGLIPPAANWHPCLLVEISPHDGPAPAGQYVWENNNLGQKNITIANAFPGQLLEFPYYFGHSTATDPFVTLDVKRIKAPKNLQLFVELKRPQLLEAMASTAGVALPIGEQPPSLPLKPSLPLTPLVPTSPIATLANTLPLRFTFLEEAKIALSSAEDRQDGEGLILTFPHGSTVEIGRGHVEGPTAEAEAETPSVLENSESMEEGGPEERLAKPAFDIAHLEGVNVLALNPGLKLAKLKVPMDKPGMEASSLKVRVPENAVPGDNLIIDVAERNSKGQLVGGVRLQVNVVP